MSFPRPLALLVCILIAAAAGVAAAQTSVGFPGPGTTIYPDGGLSSTGVAVLPDEGNLSVSALDPTTGYGYFATSGSPASLVKVALGAEGSAPRRVASLALEDGDSNVSAIIIDPPRSIAYLGTTGTPGRVIRVELGAGDEAPRRAGSIDLLTSDGGVGSMAFEPDTRRLIVGTTTTPGRVIRFEPTSTGETPLFRAGATTLADGEGPLSTAIYDPQERLVYFGTGFVGGRVIMVDPELGGTNPARLFSVSLPPGEEFLVRSFIDVSTRRGFFVGSPLSGPGFLVEFDLGSRLSPHARRARLNFLAGETRPLAVAYDEGIGAAFIGVEFVTTVARVIRVSTLVDARPERVGFIELDEPFESGLQTAFLRESDSSFWMGALMAPSRVIRFEYSPTGPAFTRESSVNLQQPLDSFALPVADPIAGAVTFVLRSSSPDTRVTFDPGTGPAGLPTVGQTVAFPSGVGNPASVVRDAAGRRVIYGTDASPARLLTFREEAPESPAFSLTLESGENNAASAVIDAAGGFALFGTRTSPGRVVKVRLGDAATTPTRVAVRNLSGGENNLAAAIYDSTRQLAWFGTATTPARIVRVSPGAGDSIPTRLDALTLAAGQGPIASAVISPDGARALFGLGDNAGRIVQVALPGDGAPQFVGILDPDASVGALGPLLLDPVSGLAYAPTSEDLTTRLFQLGFGASGPELSANFATRLGGFSALAFAPGQRSLLLGSTDALGAGYLEKVALEPDAQVHAYRVQLPEDSRPTAIEVYTATSSTLRLAIFGAGPDRLLLWESEDLALAEAPGTLRVALPASPALARLGGELWLAWKSDDPAARVAFIEGGGDGEGLRLPFAGEGFPAALAGGRAVGNRDRWAILLEYVGASAARENWVVR